jgi:hypothetical protein
MHQSVLDRRNRKIIEKIEKTGLEHRFQKKLEDSRQNEAGDSQNKAGEGNDRQHCQSKKTDQQAGLLPRVRFPVKKVHGLFWVVAQDRLVGNHFANGENELRRHAAGQASRLSLKFKKPLFQKWSLP